MARIMLVALCLVAFAGAPVAHAAEPGGTLAVVNQKDSTISLVDLARGQSLRTVKTGDGPHEVEFSADGRTAAVTNYGGPQFGGPGSSLTIVRLPAGEVVKTISLSPYAAPHGIAWLDADRVLVTCEVSKALVVVNVTAGKVERVMATDQIGTHMLALTSDKGRAYTANVGSSTVTGFEVGTGKKLWQVSVGKGCEGIGVSPDGSQVWTGNRGENTISVIDTRKGEETSKIQSPGLPYRVAFTPDGARVIVPHPMANEIIVFDAKTTKVLKRISTAHGPVKFDTPAPGATGITIHPDGHYAFASIGFGAAVAVVDLETGEVVRKIPVGQSPDGIAWSPLKLTS